MFNRVQWRIAAGYIALSAVVLFALGVYLLGFLRAQQPSAQETERITAALAVAFAAAAVLAIALSIVVTRVTVGSLDAVMQAARRFAAGNLDQTIPVRGRDEVSLLAHAFNDMAERLRRHIRAVEDEQRRLATVLGHMADGLVIIDATGSVHLVNAAAARLLETPAGRSQGRSAMAVVRDHELAWLVQRALEAPSGPQGPILVDLGPPGRQRTVQAVASRVPGGDGGAYEVLLVLQDVTELRRTETVRREFVANVSHELRTPAASLKALVETLEAGALDDPEVARDFLGRMHVEVDGLAQLVEELLELSRIESGRVALRVEPMDIGPVVAAAAERLRPQAERSGIALAVDAPEGLPQVAADPERIQQVVVNLVHNAVKFTPPGGNVAVRMRLQKDAIMVQVADDGAGISREALPRLFERFYKTDPARSTGGTGLGLAIAKHLVQAHGGRIWAESHGEGQGATFTFTLPVASGWELS